MGSWIGGVTSYGDEVEQASHEDPLDQQMRLLRELKDKLLGPASKVENDELAIQMSNAASLAEIAINTTNISSALASIAQTLANFENKSRGVETIATLDDVSR
jgi:hypothetical protein